MKDYFLYLFIILVCTVPFIYRLIRIGEIGWFIKNDKLEYDQKYHKAEKFRVLQVLFGFGFFLFHGNIYWGWKNIILFIFLTLSISMCSEIIGSRSGLIFGGKYQYNIGRTPGYIFGGIPLLIPVAWFGLIYMSLNFFLCLTKIEFPYDLESFSFLFIIIPSLMVMFVDLILDPIAVDENRWHWNNPGQYYGIPIMNFLGWFGVSVIILTVFFIIHFPVVQEKNQSSFLLQYSPGMLFFLLHVIVSRPCFERGLMVPGILSLTLASIYLFLFFLQYSQH